MPRLLIVTTVADTLKAFLLPYADHFRSLGWRVDALANGVDTSDVCRAHFDAAFDIGWYRKPVRNWRMRRILGRVRQVVASGRYDIVHVHTPIAAFLTRWAIAHGRLKRRPCVIYTVHGFHFFPGNNPVANLVYTAAEKLAASWTDYLVTINETDRQAALRLAFVSAERLRPMPGIGIDRTLFFRSAVDPVAVREARRAFRIPDEAAVFVMIAEFIGGKRHRDAVIAFARMRNRNAHLIFVGSGPGQDAIQDEAARSTAAGRVHFAGLQTDVRPYILGASAVILPSKREGLPRSVMESLCCGVPVIASDIRGARDLLAEGGGSLYRCGDVEALAERLDWYAVNPDRAAEIGLRAGEQMDRYDIANILRMHGDLYSTAIRNQPSESHELMAHV